MEQAIKKQENDHEHETRRQFNVIFNGRSKLVTKRELTFEEIVALTYDNQPPAGPNLVFTVTYRRAEGHKPEGSLVEGQSIKMKEGMIFNVSVTDKS